MLSDRRRLTVSFLSLLNVEDLVNDGDDDDDDGDDNDDKEGDDDDAIRTSSLFISSLIISNHMVNPKRNL